eukprot:355536-Chlamydomonas_euryale.AAC.1
MDSTEVWPFQQVWPFPNAWTAPKCGPFNKCGPSNRAPHVAVGRCGWRWWLLSDRCTGACGSSACTLGRGVEGVRACCAKAQGPAPGSAPGPNVQRKRSGS